MNRFRPFLPLAVFIFFALALLGIAPSQTVVRRVSAADNDALPSLERQMISLVNQERGKSGLKPLKSDDELTRVAREHSADMLLRRYFSHVTPDGVNPFERMRLANVKYHVAAENIAVAPTLEMAHVLLMESPGHRSNILYKGFSRVGIGIIDGGSKGIMISQEFRD